VFAAQKLRVLLGIGAIAVTTSVNYLIVYMPTYVVKTLKLPPSVVSQAARFFGVLLDGCAYVRVIYVY
jgi:MHS family proline/betaine transporter-like MFS transporter